MSKSWQVQLRESVRRPEDFARIIGQPVEAVFATKRFPIIATDSYLRRIDFENLSDPLLLQILPTNDEAKTLDGYSLDPLMESASLKGSGLIQKYHGRLLVVCGSTCAIHCRYCFRKNFGYSEQKINLEEIFSVLQDSPDVWEIILSGGDPLCMDDKNFAELFEALCKLSQIRSIRIHTRVPIVLPDRINEELLATFRRRGSVKLAIVVHSNHPNELRLDAAEALKQLGTVCDFFLNQSVLLKNINDSYEVQIKLCHELLNLGILPYYIHQLDAVAGAHHFMTEATVGKEIVTQLQAELPGYAVPRYVTEIPGGKSKSRML